MIEPNQIAPLKGLVLAGGRSTRMGSDKGLLEWQGKPQREYLVDLLESTGIETYVSCRPDQAEDLSDFNLIIDLVEGQGPLGAIYSAFSREPEAAWLVVACDMPLLDAETLKYLKVNRQPQFAATAFRAPAFSDGSPDPLLAIWEPKIATVVAQELKEGRRCARKTLIKAGVYLLEPNNPEALLNINTPQEMEAIALKNMFVEKRL